MTRISLRLRPLQYYVRALDLTDFSFKVEPLMNLASHNYAYVRKFADSSSYCLWLNSQDIYRRFYWSKAINVANISQSDVLLLYVHALMPSIDTDP